MLKVKLVPMTLIVPVIDNSGDHDCKISEAEMLMMQQAIDTLKDFSPTARAGVVSIHSETVRQGVSQNARRPLTEDDFDQFGRRIHPGCDPVSQTDPVIDTTVRDSEMRSNAPEMSLDEFRERPERTKTPPRPRANSWRHDK